MGNGKFVLTRIITTCNVAESNLTPKKELKMYIHCSDLNCYILMSCFFTAFNVLTIHYNHSIIPAAQFLLPSAVRPSAYTQPTNRLATTTSQTAHIMLTCAQSPHSVSSFSWLGRCQLLRVARRSRYFIP